MGMPTLCHRNALSDDWWRGKTDCPKADRAVTRDRFAPKRSNEHELGGQAMERGLKAPLSPHEEVTLHRIAIGISKASQLPPRDVAHLIRLCLVADNEGRLSLTDIGRERYRALPKAAGMTAVADEGEAAAAVANYVFGGR
jgi:hypothetical protein